MSLLALSFSLAFSKTLAITPPAANWQHTLDTVTKAVVSIQTSTYEGLDDERESSSYATGFVVDKDRGILLTNRHVIGLGPSIAYATFLNNEVVALEEIYRDPLHDFGFYKFDPSKIKYMDLVELPLVPSAATVGTEIRVVGNDAGEKLSILDGTLARLDRPAPEYGKWKFNDFNTFYIQAASSTSGGSSGSPVVNIHGQVVALNAGGSTAAASSFYLPLDRIVRAFGLIQKNLPIPRGTLEVEFRDASFDQLNRLGISNATTSELRARFPNRNGALVVHQIIPEGPADGQLREGDILLRVNQEWVSSFVLLEQLLDEHVEQTIPVEIERAGTPLAFDLLVSDLEKLSPNRYITVGDAVFHELSLQMARHANIPTSGIFLANNAYSFGRGKDIPGYSLIREINGTPISSLDQLEETLKNLSWNTPTPIRFSKIANPRVTDIASVEIDDLWFPAQDCAREPFGDWQCEPISGNQTILPPKPLTPVPLPAFDPYSKKVAPSVVHVSFRTAHFSGGLPFADLSGIGAIVDREKGLILTDRGTVPVSFGDITVSLGVSTEVPAALVYLHPIENFAILRVDPSVLTNFGELKLAEKPLAIDEFVLRVGIEDGTHLRSSEYSVRSRETIDPTRATYVVRGANSAKIVFDTDSETLEDGLLLDAKGHLKGMVTAFFVFEDSKYTQKLAGIDASLAYPMVNALRNGETPHYRALGFELEALSPVDAVNQGFPASALPKPDKAGHRNLLVWKVSHLWPGTPAANALRLGDFLIAADQTPVYSPSDLGPFTQKDQLTLDIVRNSERMNITVETYPMAGDGLKDYLVWAGLGIQEIPAEVWTQTTIDRVGVYVSAQWPASPGARDGVRTRQRILEVNGSPIQNLSDFWTAVSNVRTGESVRLRTIDLQNRVTMVTIRPHVEAFPTVLYRRSSNSMTHNGWEKKELGTGDAWP